MRLTDIIQLTCKGPAYAAYITALTGTGQLLNSIVVTNPGSGYTSVPSVSITGGGGTGATAVAVVQNNAVVAINITNPGSGFTSTPSVTLTGGGFDTAATASATIVPTALAGIPTAGVDISLTTMIAPLLLGSPKKINFYYLRAGTDAQSSPNIIRPNDYNGATNQKVWEWIGVNGPGGSI